MSGAYGSGRPTALALHGRMASKLRVPRFVDNWSEDTVRVWNVPLEPCAAEPCVTRGDDTLTADEQTAIAQLRSLAQTDQGIFFQEPTLHILHWTPPSSSKKHPETDNCSVLLYELFTSNTFYTHRPAFVRAFSHEARQLGMLLVLDDAMCSIRCGRTFSHQYYGAEACPDLIMVGKAWLLAGLICVGSPAQYDAWFAIGGITTVDADWIMLRRTLHFLRVVRGNRIVEHCCGMGHAVRTHLAPLADRMPGAVLSGVGAMWFTNMRFSNKMIRRSMQFQRLLLPFTACIDDIPALLAVNVEKPPYRICTLAKNTTSATPRLEFKDTHRGGQECGAMGGN